MVAMVVLPHKATSISDSMVYNQMPVIHTLLLMVQNALETNLISKFTLVNGFQFRPKAQTNSRLPLQLAQLVFQSMPVESSETTKMVSSMLDAVLLLTMLSSLLVMVLRKVRNTTL